MLYKNVWIRPWMMWKAFIETLTIEQCPIYFSHTGPFKDNNTSHSFIQSVTIHSKQKKQKQWTFCGRRAVLFWLFRRYRFHLSTFSFGYQTKFNEIFGNNKQKHKVYKVYAHFAYAFRSKKKNVNEIEMNDKKFFVYKVIKRKEIEIYVTTKFYIFYIFSSLLLRFLVLFPFFSSFYLYLSCKEDERYNLKWKTRIERKIWNKLKILS